MEKKRPINLDLTKFHFPPMAIASIIHRITGVLLFLFLPLMLYLLHISTRSAEDFLHTGVLLHNPWMIIAVWVMLSAVFYHLLAGIRHLIMDLGYGESLSAGRISAYIVFTLTLILIVLTGVWLW